MRLCSSTWVLARACITLDRHLRPAAWTAFVVRKVLVIAPLRVARDTWPAEIQKWDHLHGPDLFGGGRNGSRAPGGTQTAGQRIYIINRENVQWLIEESGIPFDYDMVVIDELSSFKSHQAKRFRSLMKVRPRQWSVSWD